MKHEQHDHGPFVEAWLKEPVWLPESDLGRIGQLVHHTPQQRGWLPRRDLGRFESMFNATRFVIAGVIVALFGGFSLAGVMTMQRSETAPIVGASASASASIETDDSRSDILPGVSLSIEHVMPGVDRVLSDGQHDLSTGVQGVAVTSSGDVWAELGTPGDWRVVQLGAPGASQRQTRKSAWQLGVTPAGQPLLSGGRELVFEDGTWMSPKGQCGAWGLSVDGECWHNAGDRPGITSNHWPVRGSGVGLTDDLGPWALVAVGDGTGWATVRSVPDGAAGPFRGIAHYDGAVWTYIPYEPDTSSANPDAGPAVSDWYTYGLPWVGPDGVVRVPARTDYESTESGDVEAKLGLLSWDGNAWATDGPVPDGTWFFDGSALIDGKTLSALDLPLPQSGIERTSPQGTAWVAANGRLYVITPEALAAAE